MDNISLFDFVVIVACIAVVFLTGFFCGRIYEQTKRPKPKRDAIGNFYAARDRLDQEWEKRHPLTPWQLEQARGMRNIYSTDWHQDRPAFLPESDKDKPN